MESQSLSNWQQQQPSQWWRSQKQELIKRRGKDSGSCSNRNYTSTHARVDVRTLGQWKQDQQLDCRPPVREEHAVPGEKNRRTGKIRKYCQRWVGEQKREREKEWDRETSNKGTWRTEAWRRRESEEGVLFFSNYRKRNRNDRVLFHWARLDVMSVWRPRIVYLLNKYILETWISSINVTTTIQLLKIIYWCWTEKGRKMSYYQNTISMANVK